MKAIALAVALMLLFFVAPTPVQTAAEESASPQLTDAQRTEIEKILTAAHKDMLEASDKLTNVGFEKYISDSFQEGVSSGNRAATSKDALLKNRESNFSQRASQIHTPHLTKVFVLSPESAYVLLVGGLRITTKTGREGGYGFAQTFVWRKEASGWKVLHMHWSSW